MEKLIDMDLIYATIDGMVKDSSSKGNKSVLILREIKVMLYLMYALCLRPTEAIALNIDSFTGNYDNQDLGNFGKIKVAGRKTGRRTIIVRDRTLPGIMEDFMLNVRPNFKKAADEPGEPLFLTFSGKRVSYALLFRCFNRVLTTAGLGGQRFVLYDIRKAAMTRDFFENPIPSMPRMCSWHHVATTEKYIQSLKITEIESTHGIQNPKKE